MSTAAALAALAALVALSAGCAAPAADDKPAAETRAPREYRTGSNMPLREPSKPMTQEERDKEAQKMRDLQQSSRPGMPTN